MKRKIYAVLSTVLIFIGCFLFTGCGDIPDDVFDVSGHTFVYDAVYWTNELDEERLWKLFGEAGINNSDELDEFVKSYEETSENQFTFKKDGTFLHTAKVNGELKILESGYYEQNKYSVNCYKEKGDKNPIIEARAANNSAEGFDNCYFWVEIYTSYYEDMSAEFIFNVRFKLKQS